MAEVKHRNILKNVLVTFGQLSADPTAPPEGQAIIWVSDGTGTGDDGDLMLSTTTGGVTKIDTLNDFSA